MENHEYPTRDELVDAWLDDCRSFNDAPVPEIEERLTKISLDLRLILGDFYSSALMGDFSDTERMELDVIETALYDLRLPAKPTLLTTRMHNHLLTGRLESIHKIHETDLTRKEPDTGINIHIIAA